LGITLGGALVGLGSILILGNIVLERKIALGNRFDYFWDKKLWNMILK